LLRLDDGDSMRSLNVRHFLVARNARGLAAPLCRLYPRPAVGRDSTLLRLEAVQELLLKPFPIDRVLFAQRFHGPLMSATSNTMPILERVYFQCVRAPCRVGSSAGVVVAPAKVSLVASLELETQPFQRLAVGLTKCADHLIVLRECALVLVLEGGHLCSMPRRGVGATAHFATRGRQEKLKPMKA
jgi:hypothetical protein